MESLLKEKVSEIAEKLYQQKIFPGNVLVNVPPKEYSCDFTVVIFPIAKAARKSPDQAAREIAEELKNLLSELESYEVIKGFLNLTFKDEYWINFFDEKISEGNFGSLPSTGKKTMIEYCGPNTNKPLHLGHLRNIFIGYSMSEILKAAGNEVIKVNIYNDRGIHICKSMLAYQKWGKDETPAGIEMKGDHFAGKYYVMFEQQLKMQASEFEMGGISEDEARKQAPLMLEAQEMLRKWEGNDPEVRNLWEKMNCWVYEGFEETYRNAGIDFDRAYYESQTYQLGKKFVEEGIEKKIFFRKEDGSAWVDLTVDGLDQKLLLRADGTSVYVTQDIATANERWKDYHPDTMIYTVANEQDYHFKVLKLVCQKLSLPFADGIYHLSYGMVDLPTGRMKSREGTVVDADDLMEEMKNVAEKLTREQGKIEGLTEEEAKDLFRMLGLGALKFFLLKVDPKKRMIFNPEESIDLHGFTGPYIQYTHARIKSVLRKAELGGSFPKLQALEKVNSLQKEERDIILHLQRFPAAIQEAALSYSPSAVANYLYHLAKTYNHFYQELPILNAEEMLKRDFRLQLSIAVASVLSKGMKLLGMEAPERM